MKTIARVALLAAVTTAAQPVPAKLSAIACGFIEDTVAVCWQFDPATGAFVRIGGWTT
jgi:hypothetical protein